MSTMSTEINRKAPAPLEELEALAYDAAENLSHRGAGTTHPLSKQHSKIRVATKTHFLAEEDGKGPKRYSSFGNEIWSESQSGLPGDVRRLSVGSSRQGPRQAKEAERRRASHMQLSPSHDGRWGWETRLREAEADLSSVKAKRSSFFSKATPLAEGSPVDHISNLGRTTSFALSAGAYPGNDDQHEKITIERAKSSRVSSFGASGGRRLHDDFGHHLDAADVRATANADRSETRAPSYKSGSLTQRRHTTGSTFAFQHRTGNEIKRSGSDGATLWDEPTRSFLGEEGVDLNGDRECLRAEGEQRLPGVGDRWACQVLMEELTNMKAELQRAKEREGTLERQLRTVIVERDSIQRLWENEHSKVTDMKRCMQSALSDASNKLRARLSRPKQTPNVS